MLRHWSNTTLRQMGFSGCFRILLALQVQLPWRLLPSPTLACRQVWSKKMPPTGKMLFLLCQRNQYHSPVFAGYVQITSSYKVWPSLSLQMEQNYSHRSITFWVEMFTEPSASIPRSISLSHPSWGSLKVCTRFSVLGGGGTTDPFLLQGSCSAAKVGHCGTTGCHRMKKGG